MFPIFLNCCDHCTGADEIFSRNTASRDLKRYRRKGPDKSTLLLLENLPKKSIEGKKLLDIGGGIGAISFELFKYGLAESVHVDASAGYLETSRKEAEEQGLNNRITYHYGDFTDLAGQLGVADIVTLDRVVCCYPDMEKLIEYSAAKSNKYLGLVYPRDRFPTRIVLAIGNLWFRIRKLDFRTYLHPPQEIIRQLKKCGFHMVYAGQTLIWESVVFKRG